MLKTTSDSPRKGSRSSMINIRRNSAIIISVQRISHTMIRPFGGSSTRWHHSLARSCAYQLGKLYTTRYVRIATPFPFLSGWNYSPLSRLAVSHFALFSLLKRWLSAWRWRSSTLGPAWDQRQLSSMLRHIPDGQNGLMGDGIFSILFLSLLFFHALACPCQTGRELR